MKKAQHKWVVCEEKLLVHVLPETDILPHGVKITDSRYELSHICGCNPKIKAIDRKGREYIKPVVIHNSFEQNKFLDEVISM